jgi:hypothetical protein
MPSLPAWFTPSGTGVALAASPRARGYSARHFSHILRRVIRPDGYIRLDPDLDHHALPTWSDAAQYGRATRRTGAIRWGDLLGCLHCCSFQNKLPCTGCCGLGASCSRDSSMALTLIRRMRPYGCALVTDRKAITNHPCHIPTTPLAVGRRGRARPHIPNL